MVPVVVQPTGNEPYIAAAKLQISQGQDPPYTLIKLYDDPPLENDNQYRDSLREIEVDSAGNVYVLNVHCLNESDILWRFKSNGAVEHLDLARPDSDTYIPTPIAMHMSDATEMLYLTSARSNTEDGDSAVIYGFSTDGDLTLERTVTVGGMRHVTSITEDSTTKTLWVVGFNMDDIPDYPNPMEPAFYQPCLVKIPLGIDTVEAQSFSGSRDLGLPMSVLWTETVKCGSADIDSSGDINFGDYALLANEWLDSTCEPSEWCAGADINKDGKVGFVDVLILAENWLDTNCSP